MIRKKVLSPLADKYREKWDDTGGLKAYSRPSIINETSGWISRFKCTRWLANSRKIVVTLIPNRRVR